MQSFEIELNYEAIAKNQKPRKRCVGGGRKARLERVEDKLFFILFYFKCYPTFDVAGVLFDLHHSRVHRWMLRLQPLLEKALGKKSEKC
ncbi:helix-turn-helix domain-containing protein [Nostoc sp. 'Peltigera malacea cyanobiont' DB3992]|uniref:helix-turn-helix domain-containing protein n=1 Tax=Nostoc sp. 'Peltigera malacea cyanobiont' DB3992 TaxID=1206980 RepID=UPI00211E12AC|nr:transposase family protein [Nostoc sp. 'Peltigera malacea cyanobiont' DB3992]